MYVFIHIRRYTREKGEIAWAEVSIQGMPGGGYFGHAQRVGVSPLISLIEI